MLADARSLAFLARASLAVVLADDRSLTFLVCAPSAPVLADARSSTFHSLSPLAQVLAESCALEGCSLCRVRRRFIILAALFGAVLLVATLNCTSRGSCK